MKFGWVRILFIYAHLFLHIFDLFIHSIIIIIPHILFIFIFVFYIYIYLQSLIHMYLLIYYVGPVAQSV